ncbi:MAG: hypothetical protein ACE5FA_11225, partial [Dehalococcoidia bacterium]
IRLIVPSRCPMCIGAMNGDGLAINRLATWDEISDEFTLFPDDEARQAYATWANLSVEDMKAEIDRREQFLGDLMDTQTVDIPDVNEAVEEFYLKSNRPSGEG